MNVMTKREFCLICLAEYKRLGKKTKQRAYEKLLSALSKTELDSEI